MNPKLTELFGTEGADHLRACRQFLILYLRNQEQLYVAYMEQANYFACWLLPKPFPERLLGYYDWPAPVICGSCGETLGSCEGGAIKESCSRCRPSVGMVRGISQYEIQRLSTLLRVSQSICTILVIGAYTEVKEFNATH